MGVCEKMKKIYEVDLKLNTENAETKIKSIDKKFQKIEKSLSKQATSAKNASDILNKGLESSINLSNKLSRVFDKAVANSKKFKENIVGGLKTGVKLASGLALGVLAAAGALMGMVKGSQSQKQSGIQSGLSQRSKASVERAEKNSGGVAYDFNSVASSLMSWEGKQQASNLSGLDYDKVSDMLKKGDTANLLRQMQKGLANRIKDMSDTQAVSYIQNLQQSGLNIGEGAESFVLNERNGSRAKFWNEYDKAFSNFQGHDFNAKNSAENAMNTALDKITTMLQNLATKILPPLCSAFEWLAKFFNETLMPLFNLLGFAIQKVVNFLPTKTIGNAVDKTLDMGKGLINSVGNAVGFGDVFPDSKPAQKSSVDINVNGSKVAEVKGSDLDILSAQNGGLR